MSPEGKPINQESTSIQRTYRIHAKEGIMHNTTVNNRLSARRGVEWYKEAYELFKKAPFALIALSIANILASLVFSQIPVLGYFLQIASGMVFSFGSCLVIDQLYRAGTFQWHLLLAPIKSRPMEILGFWILSLMPYLMGIAMAGLFLITTAALNFEQIRAGAGQIYAGQVAEGSVTLFSFISPSGYLILFFIGLLTALVSLSMQFFGGYLIVLSHLDPVEAVKLSIKGTFSNAGAMTLAGLMGVGLIFLAILTLGIGLFVVVPILALVTYRAYCDIFRSTEADSLQIQTNSLPSNRDPSQ